MFPEQLLERLWLCVTFDCNLTCSYCVSNSSPRTGRRRIEFDAFQQLVDEAALMGFQQLAISGGEPLLHPDILPMLQHAVSRRDTVLLTNATLLRTRGFQGLRELARKLAVQVSLDSGSPAFHDRKRGPGSWVRAVRGMGLLQEWGFAVSVRTTLAGQTDLEIEELHRFLRRLGIPAERSYLVPVARGGRSQEGLPLEEGDLMPEPTLAADGLYLHPLRVAPSQAITRDLLPLNGALGRLAEAEGGPARSKGSSRYR